jgi:hypothetical protein
LSAKASFVVSKDLLLLLKTQQRSHQRRGKEEKEFGEEEHAKRTRAEDMIDFCYVRALLPFAFLVVARLFFPADRRRRVNFVNFRFARSDDDEKDDSPNE